MSRSAVSENMNRNDEYKKHREQVIRAVKKADYAKAYKLAKHAYKTFPDVPFSEVDFYTVAADYAAICGGVKGKKLHTESVMGLRSVMRKLMRFEPYQRNILRNEYYFQTRQFKKQYELGIEEYKSTKSYRAFYSSGVGAAWYANEMFKKGQVRRSQSWAQKSVEAWEQFFKHRKNYYNPYVHYALALGFLGRAKEMEASLAKAQKLSRKPKNFSEFKEVRDIIKESGLCNAN